MRKPTEQKPIQDDLETRRREILEELSLDETSPSELPPAAAALDPEELFPGQPDSAAVQKAQQAAAIIIQHFDQDGDRALNQGELASALDSLLQYMQSQGNQDSSDA